MTDTSRLVAAIQRNSREDLRVSIDTYRGHTLLHLRVCCRDEDGQMRSGRQGVALRLDLVDDLLEAIEDARAARHGEG